MKRVGRGKRPKSLKRVESGRRTVSLTHFDLKRSCKNAEVLANRPQFVLVSGCIVGRESR